jgi:chemotaxis protein histidine kinase CheA
MELLTHQFEQELVVLRERDRLSGNDLLSLPIHLKALFERIDLIRGVMQRAAGFRRVVSDAGSAPDGLTAEIQRLAARVAETQRKQVRVAAELAGFDGLPEAVRGALKDMAFQLIRNAVYHGIEAPEERARVDKPLEGTIRITLRPVGSGRFEFIVRDDGRGLVPQHIREALLASGRHRIEDVNALDERTLLSKIFEPGFSTAAQNADCDAGRGVGLDLVKAKLMALRAQLKLDTQPGQFTEFRIQFAA